MSFSASALIDWDWHNALQDFSGNDNVVSYYIFKELGDGDGYDDDQVALSLTEISQIRLTFKQLSNITGTSFVETSDYESANVNVYSVSKYDDPTTGGQASKEDGWYDVTWKNDGSSLMTDDETQTLVHEIGHIAGLDHPNDNGWESGWDQTLSTMSYFEGDFMPITYTELDIEALQMMFNTAPVASKVTDFYDGSGGADELKGTIRPDQIIGHGGGDDLRGVRGSDTMLGMQGDDIVRGGNGRDVLSGGAGSDEIYGGFGLNTFNDEKDGSVDEIYFKSDQFAYNYIYDKAGNNPSGAKADKIEKLDSIDEIYVQGVATNQLSFSSVNHTNGLGSLDGIGIYVSGYLEAVYTGGDLSAAQLRSMTVGVDA